MSCFASVRCLSLVAYKSLYTPIFVVIKPWLARDYEWKELMVLVLEEA